MILTVENRGTQKKKKAAQCHLYPPQISQGLTWEQTLMSL